MSGIVINSYRFAVAASGYPSGAAVAFGLRELPGYGWTGALIRVRRGSDNTEQDFYQGASAGDLNTTRGGGGTSLTSWVGANNGFIRTWYDQSGNGNDSYQTTSSTQPIIVESGTVITVNGKPSVKFRSANNEILLLTTGITCAENWTSIMVAKRQNTSSRIAGLTGSLPGIAWATVHYSDSNMYVGSGSGYIVTNSTDTSTDQSIYNGTMAGAIRTMRRNGVDKSTSFTSGSQATNFTQMGGSDYFGNYGNGYLQELVHYSSDKSSDNTTLETAGNSYYGAF